MDKFLKLIDNRRVYYALITLNALVSVTVFIAFRHQVGGDLNTYMGLAEGIQHGRYSYFWFFKDYLPDTFRNPGYPLLLYILITVWKNILFIQVVQLSLYFISVFLALKIFEKFSNGYFAKNIFLLFLLPNLHIPITSANIMPDLPTAFFVIASIFVDEKMSNKKWGKFILLGILYGIIFQMRSVFILFPFIKIAFDFMLRKKEFNFLKSGILLFIFVLTMMPYGLWNYKHHGVFKFTSIEGGGGVMHNSYWSFKLPGHIDTHYWVGNKFGDEMLRFTDTADRKKNLEKYDREWRIIDSVCAQYRMNSSDTIQYYEMLEAWKTHKGLPEIYNSKFSIEREHLLTKFTLKFYLEEPLFTIKTRIYSGFRLWITAIQFSELKGKSGAQKLVAIYPFVITSFTFFSFLILIFIALWQRKIRFSDYLNIFLPIIYLGMIYLPFAIQSRYTIPGRLPLIILIAISFAALFENRLEKKNL